MPTRAELRALAHELRHAHTRLLPLDVAERVQHAIVRLEDHLVSPVIDAAAIDDAFAAGKRLLDECARLLRDQQ